MENKNKLIETYQRLKILKDYFVNEIPDYPVHSSSKNNLYKCRKAWWCMIRDEFHELDELKIAPVEINQRFEIIWKDYMRIVDADEYGVKPKNIQEASVLIGDALKTLEAKLGSNAIVMTFEEFKKQY